MLNLLIVCIMIFANFMAVPHKSRISEILSVPGFTAYSIENLDNNHNSEYKLRIVMDSNKQVIESNWILSATGIGLHWLGDGWLGFFGGSTMAPDCFVIIFDSNTKRLSKPIYLYKVIDIKSELVLSYDETDLSVIQIFTGKKIIIPRPEDQYFTGASWFTIRTDSFFSNDSLYLSYISRWDLEPEYTEHKLKIIKLDPNILKK